MYRVINQLSYFDATDATRGNGADDDSFVKENRSGPGYRTDTKAMPCAFTVGYAIDIKVPTTLNPLIVFRIFKYESQCFFLFNCLRPRITIHVYNSKKINASSTPNHLRS